MRKLLTKLLGDPNARAIKKLRPHVETINGLETGLKKKSDKALAAETKRLRADIEKGKSLDAILPEAFAIAREAGRRTLKQRHFDVQLIGGMAMHQGKIAEMKT